MLNKQKEIKESQQQHTQIDKFIALIQDDASIQNTLDKYYQTGQILELKEFPFLESLIKGIFT